MSANLERIQRWMQTVIMHPDGVDAGIHSDEARQHLERSDAGEGPGARYERRGPSRAEHSESFPERSDAGEGPGARYERRGPSRAEHSESLLEVTAEKVEEVIQRSQELTALERLSVYGNAYHARLLECLQGEFPAVHQALGEELFEALALTYLEVYPSRSYTLFHLADRFAGFLRETCEQMDGSEGLSIDQMMFIIDLATLEFAISQVFDGPGTEGQPPLADTLTHMSAERWPEARLIPAPCLQLLQLDHEVDTYYRAVRAGQQDVPQGEPTRIYLALTRVEYVVSHYRLEPVEYRLLQALLVGQTVGKAIGQLAEDTDVDLDQVASHLHTWFYDWSTRGFFQKVELDG